MKRVLFVSMGIDIPGGVANLAGSALTALDSFVEDGRLDRVDLLTFYDDTTPTRSTPGGRTYCAAGSRTRFLGQYVRAIRSNKPDFVLFDLVGGARVTRLPLPGVRGIPYGLMVHDVIDLDPETRPHLLPILRKTDLIIANSPTTRDRVTSLVPDRDDVAVVLSPPVSASRIDAWSHISHRPITHRSPLVLIASRLDPDQPGKGHDTLLRAWPIVLDSVPDASLVISGDGPGRPALEILASSLLPSGDSVDFVGYVDEFALGRLFADAAVFVMPSRQEGFGLVYAEAMFHGTPCIASTADAGRDVVEEGRTGLLVPYGDIQATAKAILRILENREFAQQLGARGRQICLERYTPRGYEQNLANALGLPSN